jgi:hypothetical protein
MHNTSPQATGSTSAVDRYIRSRAENIHLLRGTDGSGRRACYFVFVPSPREQAFRKAIETAATDAVIDLEHYGTVVASCYGEDPTEEALKLVREKYGYDPERA